MLDVGCWMFSSFGSGFQSASTGIPGILSPALSRFFVVGAGEDLGDSARIRRVRRRMQFCDTAD